MKKNIADKPKISIITVVFNRVDSLEGTLLSVLGQTYTGMEYIIVDGGSTDGTIDIIKKYSDRVTRWISEPDKGIYNAMNKGIDLAEGDWINFMNCGDRFASPDVLNMFNNVQEADVVYGNAMIEYPSFETPWRNVPLDQMWKRMPFCHQACFVRNSAIKSMKFDTSYRISADFNLIYSLYRQGRKFKYVDELICCYDFKDGASKNLAVRSTAERKRAVLSHGFNFGKWLYYNGLIVYIYLSTSVKKLIGTRLTTWLTRLLKA